MVSPDTSDSTLNRWYQTHVGKPTTDDEVQGYWLFAVGTLLAVVGVLLFLASSPAAAFRQWAYVLAAAGLALVFAGPIIRLPLRTEATWLVGGGLVLNAAAIIWFVAAYPEQWGQYTGHTTIMGLYLAGLALMAIGAVLVPMLTDRAELEAQVVTLESELERLRSTLRDVETDEAELAKILAVIREQLVDAKADESDLAVVLRTIRDRVGDVKADEADLAAVLEEVREQLADTAVDERDLAARLRTIATSQSRFELFEDRAGEYRWRLRHRNGNLIADSGEGYTQLHNAQGGMDAVRRDAYGAPVLLYEKTEDLPETEATFEPIETRESKATFERYEDQEGGYRWRLRHDNGEIIADSGEGYSSKTKAGTAIERVKAYVGPADYLWPDPSAFEVYEDRAGDWRWRLVHKNGNILADGGDGYASRGNARRAIETIQTDVEDMEFETYTDEAGEHRFRLRGGNDEIMADSGEGYSSKSGLEAAIEHLRTYLPEADLLEIGAAAFELFEDTSGATRWRLRHRNGQILADSGQGYTNRSSARDGIESVKLNAPNADVTDE